MTTTWKKAIAMTAAFAAISCMALAAKGDGKSAAADSPKTKAIAAARTLIAQYAAKDAGLAADKADKFVADVQTWRQSSDQKMAEARTATKDKEQLRALMEEQERALDAALAASLTAEQAARAKEILALQNLEGSVAPLLASGVAEDKVVQALPVFLKFHKTESELTAKARSKDAPLEDYAAKAEQLRVAAAKDLALIIGDSAAGAWQSRASAKPSKGGPKPDQEKPAQQKPDKPGKSKAPAAS